MSEVFNSFNFEGQIRNKQKPKNLQRNPSQSHISALHATPIAVNVSRCSDQSWEVKTSKKKVPPSTWQSFKYSQKHNKYHLVSADKKPWSPLSYPSLAPLGISWSPLSPFLLRFFSMKFTFAFLLLSLNIYSSKSLFGPVQTKNKHNL